MTVELVTLHTSNQGLDAVAAAAEEQQQQQYRGSKPQIVWW